MSDYILKYTNGKKMMDIEKGINVLSLFDGMSCGQIALERCGIKVNKYYASEIDKNSIAVTQYNYPNTIQLGDIKKIRYKDGILYFEKGEYNIGKIDLLIGGSPCFVAGTKVICKDKYKSIENVSIGDYVLTHTNKFKKVKSIGNEYKDTIIVKAQGIKPTETTKNHPYYVRTMHREWNKDLKKNQRRFSPPVWVDAGNLKKGHFIGLPIIDMEENPRGLTEEDCWLLGRYIADGHLSKIKRKYRKNSFTYQVVYSIGSHKIKEFKNNVTRKFSCYPHTKSTHRCVIYSMDFLNLIEDMGLGKGAFYKSIPMDLLLLPKNLLKKVIEGYMSGDGSLRKDEFRSTSISEELIMTLNLAIAKVYRTNSGYEFTERPGTTIIEGRKVNQKNTYSTSFRKEMKKQSTAKVIENIIWLPVKSIIETKNKKQVYNIEVEDDNSYTANNVIVHNCQGFSFSGKGLNFEDERSKLFFEYVRLKEECNPNYFLLENVKMIKESEHVISKYLGVLSIEIDSSLVSAQSRRRLYWTNISNKICQPKNKKIYLKDIIEEGITEKDKSYCIDANYYKGINIEGYLNKKRRQVILSNKLNQVGSLNNKNMLGNRIYDIIGKGKTITVGDSGLYIFPLSEEENIIDKIINKKEGSLSKKKALDNIRNLEDKSKCLTVGGQGIANSGATNLQINDFYIRKLTVIECERLQTVPDNYTKFGKFEDGEIKEISKTQRYKMLGNGWTVDVVVYIFEYLKNPEYYKNIRKNMFSKIEA